MLITINYIELDSFTGRFYLNAVAMKTGKRTYNEISQRKATMFIKSLRLHPSDSDGRFTSFE